MKAILISLELTLDESGQSGRIFTRSPAVLQELGDPLESRFTSQFADDEDREREPYLRKALEASTVTVDAYRGEGAPYELHAYFSGAAPGAHPLFACVLVPPALLDEMLSAPNAVVCESATMQVIDGVTESAIVAGLERWCGRLWPTLVSPRFCVSPWPKSLATPEGSVQLLTLFPLTSSERIEGAVFQSEDLRFVPPHDLVVEAA